MITTAQQAGIVQDRLNDIAEAMGFDFTLNITPIVGDFVKTPRVINGIFIEQPSVIVPLKGLNAYYCTNTMRIAVKTITESDKDNMDALLHTAIGGYTDGNNVAHNGLRGVTENIEDNNGVLYSVVTNCSMPSSGEVELLPEIGECVVFEMLVYFQIIQGGVLSNTPYFSLRCRSTETSTILADLESSTTRVRTSQTDNVTNNGEMQTAIGQQGLNFALSMPYLAEKPYTTLMSDILSGALSNVYELKYNDATMNGDAVVANKTWYVVMTQGIVTRKPGAVMTMNITLQIARADVYATEIGAYA